MKKFFDTPKKAIISTLCITAVVLGAAVAVPAIILNNTLIGKNEAEKTALRDAGLDTSQVSALRSELDYEDGSFRYEVDFYSNGTEYEYQILAKDGDIISRDTDGQPPANVSAENKSLDRQTSDKDTKSEAVSQENKVREAVTESVSETVNETASETVITLDEAKAAALADAGLKEEEVTFTKTQLDREDRRQVYDIEFYSDNAEYDYEINADDGTVRERSTDTFRVQSDPVSADAGSAEKYIGIDRAKEIALNHAGLTADDISFSKAKLENDDRTPEYEIEFYYGAVEYDYSIDAENGEVLEFDSEHIN